MSNGEQRRAQLFVNLAFIDLFIDEPCYFVDKPIFGERNAYHGN